MVELIVMDVSGSICRAKTVPIMVHDVVSNRVICGDIGDNYATIAVRIDVVFLYGRIGIRVEINAIPIIMMHFVVRYQGAGAPSRIEATCVTKHLAISDDALRELVCIQAPTTVV